MIFESDVGVNHILRVVRGFLISLFLDQVCLSFDQVGGQVWSGFGWYSRAREVFGFLVYIYLLFKTYVSSTHITSQFIETSEECCRNVPAAAS